jgi:hypothetical protein
MRTISGRRKPDGVSKMSIKTKIAALALATLAVTGVIATTTT